jgi:sulfonate dioxygenase
MVCMMVDVAELRKEAFIGGPKAFRPDAELQGTGKQPPAKYPKYLPTWPQKK